MNDAQGSAFTMTAIRAPLHHDDDPGLASPCQLRVSSAAGESTPRLVDLKTQFKDQSMPTCTPTPQPASLESRPTFTNVKTDYKETFFFFLAQVSIQSINV